MKSIIAPQTALIAMAALAAALTANLASATTVKDGVRQSVVHYSDLDLARPEDARRLYGRIRRAAHAVCEDFRSADLQRNQIYRECMDKAVADAVAKVRSHQVAAIAGADIQHLSKQ
jgi:UrcA family protein